MLRWHVLHERLDCYERAVVRLILAQPSPSVNWR